MVNLASSTLVTAVYMQDRHTRPPKTPQSQPDTHAFSKHYNLSQTPTPSQNTAISTTHPRSHQTPNYQPYTHALPKHSNLSQTPTPPNPRISNTHALPKHQDLTATHASLVQTPRPQPHTQLPSTTTFTATHPMTSRRSTSSQPDRDMLTNFTHDATTTQHDE
ncbi:hypothetical protein E2C01_098293 [Portunus trituberculatus]|uniref:Uncharacterized protein n=1 Tax=Portunus trituberculatus TaxID=210409 RepID=A0A5B7K814_PORTR|nr:hypothetical protein [Portunus trituberculatus]